MIALPASKERLTDAFHRLSDDWIKAANVWSDAARQDFEKEFWTEFESTTVTSIEKLQELADALAQAQHEIP